MQFMTVKNIYIVGAVLCVSATQTGQQAHCAPKANGKATVYADSFKGKKTASGSRYKPQSMSAASNKLPLGSKVEVQNKKTGKKVNVTITDKMGKNSSAVVDLSKGAAGKIGVKGTAPVSAKVVK